MATEELTDRSLLGEPAARGARLVALGLLERAVAAQARIVGERADEEEDPEALHDFRVAVRRLRSWLRAFESVLGESVRPKTARRLAALARATGASRDAEVHIAWLREQHGGLSPRERVGAGWLVERTSERKRTADEALREKLARDFDRVERKLSRSLESYTARVHLARDPAAGEAGDGAFGAVVGALVAEHGAELRRRLASVHRPEDQKEAHQARIAAKRLRYLLEPVASHVAGAGKVVGELQSLQDALGDMHDVDVFSGELVVASAEAAGGAVAEQPARGRRRRDPRPGLERLAHRLRERGARAYAEVEGGWLNESAAPFFERLDGVVAALRRSGGEGREIERKFLLSRVPAEAAAATALEIEQGYLPGRKLVERLRRVRLADGSERCYRTVKVGRGLSRFEVEEEAAPELFAALWPLTEGRRVRKRRYDVGGDRAAAWVVDDFADRALVLAEVELTSPDAPAEPPEWLRRAIVREVTDDEAYSNAKLAR